MGEPSSLTPWKKRKTENEYSLCLICQEQSIIKVIKNPNNESLKKLLSLSRERAEYGHTKVFEFVERSKNVCADDLPNNKACYHKKCYSEFTNTEKRNRTIQRYTDALEQGQATIVKRKAGRPSSSTLEIENEVRQLRSQSIQYNEDFRIICQSPSGTINFSAVFSFVGKKYCRNYCKFVQKIGSKRVVVSKSPDMNLFFSPLFGFS